MLVLSRKLGESIIIGDPNGEHVKVSVVDVRGDKVRLGIEAPKHIPVHREEVSNQIYGKDGNEDQDTKGKEAP